MKKTILLLICAVSVMAATEKPTKVVMQDALNHLVHLLPYMSSPMKFKDTKNEKDISNHLESLTYIFKSAKHNKDINLPTFYPNFQTLNENLDEALLNFNLNNKTFARLRLNETTNLCLSCHSQIPKDHLTSFILNEKKIEKIYEDEPFERANLYFILRNYDKAIQYYKKNIAQKLPQVSNKKAVMQDYDKSLYLSFYKTLLIEMKILRSPDEALTYLEKVESNLKLPEYIKTRISKWKPQIKVWSEGKNKVLLKAKKASEIKQLMTSLETKINQLDESPTSGDFDIDLMVLSGVLANFNQMKPKNNLTGEILYWLGVSEYRLSKTLFFNIGDLYLKNCIYSFAKKPIAKKCYQTLSEEINIRYTGSAGTDIPPSIQTTLKNLKKLL